MLNNWGKINIIIAGLIANYCLSCQCQYQHSNEEGLDTNNVKQTDEIVPNNDIPTPPSTDKSKRLEAAQTLAANLYEAVKLTGMYTALSNKVKSKVGSNTDPSFVGLTEIKNALRSEASGGNLAKFKSGLQKETGQAFIVNTMIGGCFRLIKILPVKA